MDQLKGKALVAAILCSLLLGFCVDATRPAQCKETLKEKDQYAREVLRQKNRVTISRSFVNAVKNNHAIVLARSAVRQCPDGDGGVRALEIVQIDEGSSVARMGFKAGDRIESVNGIPVGELEGRRYEIESSNRWELTVVRHGKTRRMVIEVRE